MLFRSQAHASIATQLPYNCQANSMITCFHSATDSHTHTLAGNFVQNKGNNSTRRNAKYTSTAYLQREIFASNLCCCCYWCFLTAKSITLLQFVEAKYIAKCSINECHLFVCFHFNDSHPTKVVCALNLNFVRLFSFFFQVFSSGRDFNQLNQFQYIQRFYHTSTKRQQRHTKMKEKKNGWPHILRDRFEYQFLYPMF